MVFVEIWGMENFVIRHSSTREQQQPFNQNHDDNYDNAADDGDYDKNDEHNEYAEYTDYTDYTDYDGKSTSIQSNWPPSEPSW